MISLEDCIGLCGLTEAEVKAIAEHEHIPEIAAATLARHLLVGRHGVDIQKMIVDDVRAAFDAGDVRHAAELVTALRHFSAEHASSVPAAAI